MAGRQTIICCNDSLFTDVYMRLSTSLSETESQQIMFARNSAVVYLCAQFTRLSKNSKYPDNVNK